MDNKVYLLSVNISGVKCIEEEVCLNFYKKTVDKKFDPEQYRIKAIYGENGAGKSAIITAIKIVYDFISDFNYLNETKNQKFLSEIINKKSKKFNIRFEYLVRQTDIRVYKYELEIGLNDNNVYVVNMESLSVKNGNYSNNNYLNIFKSINGELINVESSDDTDEIKRKTTNLLASNSFFSLYIKNLTSEEKMDVKFFLELFLFVMLISSFKIYLAEEDQHELYFLRKNIMETKFEKGVLGADFEQYINELHKISGVNEKYIPKKEFEKYEAKIERLARFLKLFKRDLVSIDIDKKDNGDFYVCDLNLNYGDYCVNKEFESTGIKKLIRLFDCFNAASGVGIVFIDELDSNLNDIYLCKIIEYFMYYGRGQLCFTTHNLDPMSVLKDNKNSIEFLSNDNKLTLWTTRGNATPENCYRNGMIENSPFNIEASDFVGILGE